MEKYDYIFLRFSGQKMTAWSKKGQAAVDGVKEIRFALEKIAEVVPEFIPVYQRRIKILQTILNEGPIGRKALADKMNMTERPLRSESEILKQYQLINSTSAGMTITTKGEQALADASDFMREIAQTHVVERALARKLDIAEVRIVPGNIDQTPNVLYEMGLSLTNFLDQKLSQGPHTIAVTGGSTILNVAQHIQPILGHNRSFTVVPARGGIGVSAAAQANTISDLLAKRLHGTNLSLYAPENLSENAYLTLLNEPSMQHTLAQLNKADILLFSVGDANIMAGRRELDEESRRKIRENEAVGEAFGCFYNYKGEIIHRIPRIGLQIEHIQNIELPILIAGGSRKAEAITAFAKIAPKSLVLIIDEGASEMILNGDNPLK